MKRALEQYLDIYEEFWKKETGLLPKVDYDEELDTDMYVGNEDEEGYIQWKKIVRKDVLDFEEFEDILRTDIKEFLSAYYFFDFSGFVDGQRMDIDGIDEECDPLEKIEYDEDDNIVVNIGGHGVFDLPLYVENSTGNVIIIDEEKDCKYVISSTLEDFFYCMKPIE